ncbi:hypothetical protein CA265_01680 [Sphingobacteriaceae bacterium GW460-11-11-14-LB5]|nr:hypothetical protein CA265_01680 [Sphingobacteriaceae bacterium GW460-11-11-14-LB5]
MNKNIITIATGKSLYISLAVNLARSFFYWNKHTTIKFYMVTDQASLIPKDILEYIQIIKIKSGELGEGFSTKLHLDKLAPSGQTLFIDSDCLIFGNIDGIFDRFKGKDVSVIGGYINEGEWFGDIKSICKKFNVPCLPKFNGGIYYLEKGQNASKVYEDARRLEKEYDAIGFKRLRNKPNDEVIMALAMQLNGMHTIPDDGTIMSDPQACPGGYKIDLINGSRYLINPPAPSPLHQNWYPFTTVTPLIVHFLGYYTQHYPYEREVLRLKLKMENKLNPISNFFTIIKIEYGERIKIFGKSMLRPLYRLLFGTNTIKKSERL